MGGRSTRFVCAAVVASSCAQARPAVADVVTLRQGEEIHGSVVAATGTGVRLRAADGSVRAFDPSSIARVEYDSGVVVDYGHVPAAAPLAPDPSDVPPTGQDPELRPREDSHLAHPGLFAAGLSMTAVGGVAIFTGSILLLAGMGDTSCHDLQSGDTSAVDDAVNRNAASYCFAGGISLLAGAVLLGVGLPLMLHNRDRVVTRASTWVPGVEVGDRRLVLGWHF